MSASTNLPVSPATLGKLSDDSWVGSILRQDSGETQTLSTQLSHCPVHDPQKLEDVNNYKV